MSTFAVILPAAGKSTRFGGAGRKKPFIYLNGRPVWVRAVEPFRARNDVQQIVVVVSESDFDWFRETFEAQLKTLQVSVVVGGAERMNSVENALKTVSDETDFVAVHDAARPLINSEVIDRVFQKAMEEDAAIPGVRISSTVKRVAESSIVETVDRSNLWAAQTPQTFRSSVLLDAYQKRGDNLATDEAQLVERNGRTVHVVEGDPLNLKITTREDLFLAEAILKHDSALSASSQPPPFIDRAPGS
ncbi:2-C-methyl-D-erythritol 4-phosphate cytidylyltransferase [Thalassoglobus neptunius]|uniref:2-C-methyl-D-erythritol 4-phosphate cytidylyltransferase n=1 Tax=Thalassoglobus neptunius TaxID=1938619 RepID=A0A5C5WZA6_9PLAN|nr:2-C-methyl-D-erythritol 4-phosphate cytidylyltransferase [Thalassoglobus neptunius]TWT55619.1 2-C-methyl-D-erythritol 4-phosphate cytidylyltransferase [Thalassoglobus neptunius]